ncbi:MAG: glutaredoxin domain-containing protein [Spirochaetales bacterium]|nr:glutaredoxin domain-containing protein [Spirochaetales bacterium]
MFDYIEFESADGEKKEKDIILLGLTTCSFCRKGKEFLDQNGFSYRYLYLDKIDPDIKKRMKADFTDTFDRRLSYPTLIVDEKEILTGFIRIAWEKELLDEA